MPDASKLKGLAITRNGKALDPALWNRAMPVNGGDYAFAATAPGRVEWKMTVQVPYEKGKVNVAVPTLDEPGKVVSASPVSNAQPASVANAGRVRHGESTRVPTASMWTGKRKVALALAGVSAVGIVGGAVLGSRAAGLKDDAYGLCPDLERAMCRRDARERALGVGAQQGAHREHRVRRRRRDGDRRGRAVVPRRARRLHRTSRSYR